MAPLNMCQCRSERNAFAMNPPAKTQSDSERQAHTRNTAARMPPSKKGPETILEKDEATPTAIAQAFGLTSNSAAPTVKLMACVPLERVAEGEPANPIFSASQTRYADPIALIAEFRKVVDCSVAARLVPDTATNSASAKAIPKIKGRLCR